MKDLAKKKGGVNIKVNKSQSGSSVKSVDSSKKALAPGWRLSRSGKVYYEGRKNRSDKPGKRV